jgi:hypothetical protein
MRTILVVLVALGALGLVAGVAEATDLNRDAGNYERYAFCEVDHLDDGGFLACGLPPPP